jgi:hypothetical protein
MATMNSARRVHNALSVTDKLENDDKNSGEYDSLPKVVIGRRIGADK